MSSSTPSVAPAHRKRPPFSVTTLRNSCIGAAPRGSRNLQPPAITRVSAPVRRQTGAAWRAGVGAGASSTAVSRLQTSRRRSRPTHHRPRGSWSSAPSHGQGKPVPTGSTGSSGARSVLPLNRPDAGIGRRGCAPRAEVKPPQP